MERFDGSGIGDLTLLDNNPRILLYRLLGGQKGEPLLNQHVQDRQKNPNEHSFIPSAPQRTVVS
jgi:hypothetical protein